MFFIFATVYPINSKHEIRNPKQIQNPKAQNSKHKFVGTLVFKFWSLRFRSLGFYSGFDI